MKFLAWYTTITAGLVELFILGELLDEVGSYYESSFENLFALAFFAPPVVFGIKYLLKK